jgi:hypothetical protein
MKTMLAVSAFLIYGSLAWAADDSSGVLVRGTVLDSEGAVIEHAFVYVLKDGKTSDELIWRGKSKALGKIELRLEPGFYDVFISFVGFSPSCTKIRVRKGSSTNFRIRMKPNREWTEEYGDVVEAHHP